MKFFVNLLLVYGSSAHALKLADFLYGAPALEDRLAKFKDCQEQLTLWADLKDFEAAEELRARAEDYAIRWATAKSGPEFAALTVDEAIGINDQIVGYLSRVVLPPKFGNDLDLCHMRVVWIQQYHGYGASYPELLRLRKKIDREIAASPSVDAPSANEKSRWNHNITVLAVQSAIGNLRNARKVDIPMDLIALMRSW